MTSHIIYLGRNDTDNSVTFAFLTTRWEYFLPSRAVVDKVEYICRKVSAGKAVVVAKRTALREVRL